MSQHPSWNPSSGTGTLFGVFAMSLNAVRWLHVEGAALGTHQPSKETILVQETQGFGKNKISK